MAGESPFSSRSGPETVVISRPYEIPPPRSRHNSDHDIKTLFKE
jgi:hypothetical protein